MSHQLVAEAATRTTHNKHRRKKNVLSGIQTHDLRNQAAADLRLCPHGHRDWLILILFSHVRLHLRRAHAESGGTRRRTGGEVKGKEANGVGSH